MKVFLILVTKTVNDGEFMQSLEEKNNRVK